MPVTYRISPVPAPAKRKRSRKRRVAKWAGGILLAFAVLSSVGGHRPAAPHPVAVHQAAHHAPAAGKHAHKAHPLAAAAAVRAAHHLVPHPYLRLHRRRSLGWWLWGKVTSR